MIPLRTVIQTKFIKIIFTALLIAYIFLLSYLVFFSPYYGRECIQRSLNLIPLKTISQFLFSSFNINIVLTNIAGNIVAFLPMGFLIPIVFTKLDSIKKILILTALATISVESVQYITGVGASDVDDVILNVLGGILGFEIYRLIKWLIKLQFKF